MDKDLEEGIELRISRSLLTFEEERLKGEGGLCHMQHKIMTSEVKKCIADSFSEFYKKVFWSGVVCLILFLVGQVVIKKFF